MKSSMPSSPQLPREPRDTPSQSKLLSPAGPAAKSSRAD